VRVSAEGIGDARVEAEGELALARIALDGGDPAHAATHLGNALAEDPTTPAVYDGLHELDAATGDALAYFSLDGDVYIGTVAARSYLLARAGQVDEALRLLTMAVGHEPDKPWAASGWLNAPGLADRLDPRGAVASLAGLAVRLSDPVEPGLATALRPYLDLARAVIAAHAEAREFLPQLSGLARRLGAVDEAIAWCEEGDRVAPSPITAIMLAYALRSAGRLAEMEQAWLTAIQRDPDNVEVYVDLAESLASQGRLADGVAWLDRALALDPEHPKAFPSASAMRFQLDGDVAHLVRLADHWRAHPDHTYADEMLAMVCADEHWLGLVPSPSEAIANMVVQYAEKQPDPEVRRTISGSCTLSALEVPSAMAAAVAALPGFVIEVSDVPAPDLRVPIANVRHRLWHYEGTRAVPVMPPPSADAVAALRGVARHSWRHPLHAYDHAVHLSGLALGDLLGLLVHVPPPPDDAPHLLRMFQTNPVYWPRFAQAWTCLGILHHRADEPWPTSTRRAVLLDLATGVEDWTTDAALNAMAVAAWVDPAIREDVANLVGHRFLHALRAYQEREVTIVHSLAQLALVTPGMISDVTDLARSVLRDGDPQT
jgi:tetratricopeptide (TPR) repeat protein